MNGYNLTNWLWSHSVLEGMLRIIFVVNVFDITISNMLNGYCYTDLAGVHVQCSWPVLTASSMQICWLLFSVARKNAICNFRASLSFNPSLLWCLSGFSIFWYFATNKYQICGKYQNKEKPLKGQRKLGLTVILRDLRWNEFDVRNVYGIVNSSDLLQS